MYAYAKYKTTLTGNGTATVAKWSFKVNGQTQTIPDIDLATTMKENNNVVEGKLAPGTEGSFDLNLDATGSEVAIDYNIKLAVTEKPSNLRFYTDSSYTKEIASTDGVMNVSGVLSLEEVKTIQTKTIYWKWAYQTGTAANDIVANDKIDTAQRNDIEFIYNCEDTALSFIDDIDLTIILSNLLDNAFEECMNNKAEHNTINLCICQINNFNIINLTNTCYTPPQLNHNRYLSTKAGHSGIGMINVENTVKKYNGSFMSEFKDHLFTTQITFTQML